MSNVKKITEKPFFRFILAILSTALSVLVLAFSSFVIYNVANNEFNNISLYLLLIFVFLGLMHFVVFLKERTKIHFIKAVVLLIFNIVLGIVGFFAKDNPFLFALTAGLYCLTIIISRIFSIVHKPSLRNIIFNILIILFALLLGLGLLFSPTDTPEGVQGVILAECIFVAIVAFIEAMAIVLAQLKIKVLVRIVVNTFSLEIIFGLLIMIATFSFIFMAVEPAETIGDYPTALWYCFNVVTSIGFGTGATTPIGRILTVILGIYGIVVIAVVTSIIVNFYNETAGKHDQKELKDISKDEKKK